MVKGEHRGFFGQLDGERIALARDRQGFHHGALAACAADQERQLKLECRVVLIDVLRLLDGNCECAYRVIPGGDNREVGNPRARAPLTEEVVEAAAGLKELVGAAYRPVDALAIVSSPCGR